MPRRPRHLAAAVAVLGLLAAASAGWACQLPRVPAAEAERIAEVLGVEEGMKVADIGAGDGRWTLDLARRVGPAGHVFATEVDADTIEATRRHVEEAGLANVTVVEGSQTDTGLPAGCCAAILLRNVYHHFTDPAAMHAGILAALQPGGRLAVIDFEPSGNDMSQPSGTPDDRGGHGMPRQLLVGEMSAAGFEVEAEHTDWMGDEDDYCVVFRKP